FQDHLRAVDVGLDGAHGAFDDELNADSGGEMDDDVGIVNKLGDELAIFDVVEVILQVAVRFQMANVIHAAGGKIVEEDHAIAACEEALCKMESDETGTAGD